MAVLAPSARISLRPATPDDREFLVRVYGATRAEELAPLPWSEAQRDAFVRMQFEAQDRHYRQHHPDAEVDVIEVGGRPAGRLYVDRGPDDLHVVDISLLPEFRGSGIGAALLGAVLDEAAAGGRTVSLHVLADNRAARLYERLGFVAVAEGGGVYRRMEWSAP